MMQFLFTFLLAASVQLNAPANTQNWLETQATKFGASFDSVEQASPKQLVFAETGLQPAPKLRGGGDAGRVELSATSVYAFDRATGKPVYEKNPKEKVALASITKLMTAIVVLEQEKDLDREVKIPSGTISVEGSTMELLPGEVLTIRDLLYGMIVKSANDAAMVLAESTGGSVNNFVRLMNAKARDLGLEATHFANPHGLDDPENYSTAFDIGHMADHAFRLPVLKDMVGTNIITVVSKDYTRTSHYLENTNKLLTAETGVFAGKTGFTDEAGLCLVSAARRNGREIINVVLGSEDRAEDTRRLLDWEYANYAW